MQAYAPASRADGIVLIDSLEEAESVPDTPRLIKVPLGGQDTVLTTKGVAEERQFAPVLEVAESAAVGCCIVALDFYAVGKMVDVLPPIYTAANGVVVQNGHVAMAVVSA